MTEQSLNFTINIILGLEVLLLVALVPSIFYLGKQSEALSIQKERWIQEIRALRQQVNTTRKGVQGVNFTTKTLLPATLATGPWRFILPVLFRLI